MAEKNIYEKLAEVRKAVEVVEKDSTGYGYKYVSDRELLALISGTMEANHLTLIPRITPGTTKVEPWTYIKNKLHPKTKELYDEVNNEQVFAVDRWYRRDADKCVLSIGRTHKMCVKTSLIIHPLCVLTIS